MKLQEIKDQYAKEEGLNNWIEFVNKTHKRYLDYAYIEIIKRHTKAKLLETAEDINIEWNYYDKKGTDYFQGVSDGLDKAEHICRDSITNIELD